MTRIKLLDGPRPAKMRQDRSPGKQWTASAGLARFKLTIQDKAGCDIDKLTGILENLPSSYMSVCAAVSGDGEDGVAVYADLGGPVATGGKGYIDITPTADPLAVVRAMARVLGESSESEDNAIRKEWEAAIERDKTPVSARDAVSWIEDLVEYAELFTVCLADSMHWRVGHLQRKSQTRCRQWIQMLNSLPVTLEGAVPAAKVSAAQVAEAKTLGVPVTFTNSIGMVFVLVPSGAFMMGSEESAREVAGACNMSHAQTGWFIDEHPRHEVTLTAFYMSIHEVTHGQYAAVPKSYGRPEEENHALLRCPGEFLAPTKPIVWVGWNDAEAFFESLNRLEAEQGRRYSLPTEAQWEYACRAGSTTPFSFGETVSTDQANYHGEYTYADGKKGENREETVPVGSLPANAWGLHEMHGNAAEWCHDWYADYTGETATDPAGPKDKPRTQQRVIRGGAWRSYPGACRSACRLSASYHRFRQSHIGFRAVCAIPAKPAEPKPEDKK